MCRDGEHILLIQDLIVARAYRGQGLGQRLFDEALSAFSQVRMIQLNTDLADQRANRFYQKQSMKTLAEGGMISYFKS